MCILAPIEIAPIEIEGITNDTEAAFNEVVDHRRI